MTQSRYHTEDAKLLGATAQNFVTIATWRMGFVHPCYTNPPSYLNQVYNQQPMYLMHCIRIWS